MSRSQRITYDWLDKEDNEEVLHKIRTKKLEKYYQIIKEDNENKYNDNEIIQEARELAKHNHWNYSF